MLRQALFNPEGSAAEESQFGSAELPLVGLQFSEFTALGLYGAAAEAVTYGLTEWLGFELGGVSGGQLFSAGVCPKFSE